MFDGLSKEIEVKQLGEVKNYLGIKIENTENGHFLLNQKHKIVELAELMGLQDVRKVSTLLEPAYLKLEDGVFLKSGKE